MLVLITHPHGNTHTHHHPQPHTHPYRVILSGIDTTAHCSLLLWRFNLHGLGDAMGAVAAASQLSNTDTHKHITCYEGSGWGNPLIYCFLSWAKKHTHMRSLSASLPFPNTHTITHPQWSRILIRRLRWSREIHSSLSVSLPPPFLACCYLQGPNV